MRSTRTPIPSIAPCATRRPRTGARRSASGRSRATPTCSPPSRTRRPSRTATASPSTATPSTRTPTPPCRSSRWTRRATRACAPSSPGASRRGAWRRWRRASPRSRRSTSPPSPAAPACDFIADFAGKLPMDVISELLGVPREDRATLAQLGRHRRAPRRGRAGHAPRGRRRRAPHARVLRAHAGRPAQEPARRPHRRAPRRRDRRRPALGPRGDRLPVPDDRRRATRPRRSCSGTPSTGWPGTRASARRWSATPPSCPRWVEETLRYDNSTQALARLVARDVELHGEKLRAGEKAVLLVGSANRDERAFPEPDRFDLAAQHLEEPQLRPGHPLLPRRRPRAPRRPRGPRGVLPALSRLASSSPTGIVRVHSVNVRGFAALPLRLAA